MTEMHRIMFVAGLSIAITPALLFLAVCTEELLSALAV